MGDANDDGRVAEIVDIIAFKTLGCCLERATTLLAAPTTRPAESLKDRPCMPAAKSIGRQESGLGSGPNS